METLDVLIVGAGISGIGVACHLRRSQPGRSFAILEGRASFGGTWDLFRYPGIRSDSDMYTFGYSFKPWPSGQDIAPAQAILDYLRETIEEYELESAIRYGHRVLRADWSSSERRWTVVAERAGTEVVFRCRFLVTGTGYYDHERGYTPSFPGIEDFDGTVVHPQHWPQDLVHADKRVVVVGSGATAVSVVPAMAETAAHVTMLQRSPTYVVSRPRVEPVGAWLRRWLPDAVAYPLIRTKNTALRWTFYQIAQHFPERVRRTLLDQARDATGGEVDVEDHFSPSYDPWDQRMCLIPDGDLFEALRSRRAEVVTDTIDHFDRDGVVLASGRRLDADIVVTATGLQLRFLGGIDMRVDGRSVDPADLVTYRGVLFGDVPNWMAVIGYTSASWTLKVDLAGTYLCRLLSFMERRGYERVVPALDGNAGPTTTYFANIASAGYVRRGEGAMPRQRLEGPWRNRDDFFADLMALRVRPVDDGALQFA